MAKRGRIRISLVTLVTFLAVIFIIGQQGKAQVAKAQGRPVKPPAPCNNNGICEYGEFSSSQSWLAQPCADCVKKTYDPLTFGGGYPSIVSCGFYFPGMVFQHCYVGDRYEDRWVSANLGVRAHAAGIGDIDNDGYTEIFGITCEPVAIKKSKAYDHNLLIFAEGSNGTQLEGKLYLGRSSTPNVGGCVAADINKDGQAELSFINGQHFEVWRVTKEAATLSATSLFSASDYPSLIWGLDVGDADNLGDNEIILAVFASGTTLNAPKIWKWNGSIFVESVIADAECVDCTGMDVAKVRDVDGDAENEIVAGGNNSTVMIWKYDKLAGAFQHLSNSPDCGGYTQGVDAGKIETSWGNVIVVGTAGAPSTVSVWSYNNGAWTRLITKSLAVTEGPVNSLSVADLDGDGLGEIIVDAGDAYFSIYEPGSDGLVSTYSSIYGAYSIIR
jgi:hypothetical protein